MKTIRTMMILDMKQRVLLTIILLMLFCSYSMGQPQRGYAVYTEEDSKEVHLEHSEETTGYYESLGRKIVAQANNLLFNM